jgi:hypothetical protein
VRRASERQRHCNGGGLVAVGGCGVGSSTAVAIGAAALLPLLGFGLGLNARLIT